DHAGSRLARRVSTGRLGSAYRTIGPDRVLDGDHARELFGRVAGLCLGRYRLHCLGHVAAIEALLAGLLVFNSHLLGIDSAGHAAQDVVDGSVAVELLGLGFDFSRLGLGFGCGFGLGFGWLVVVFRRLALLGFTFRLGASDALAVTSLCRFALG